jgi:adenylate cyclase
VQLCVGVNYGPVVEDDTGDLFGDTVNVAARLRSLASPGQIMTTLETLAAAPSLQSVETRSLGSHVLAGKNRPVEVIEVLWEPELGNLTVMAPEASRALDALGLRLSYDGRLKELSQSGGEEITLGRENDNSIVVPHDSVSRRHATLIVRNGKFYLKDHSANGTYVRSGDSAPIVARRESVPLQGRGDISLGVDFADGPDKLIGYEIVRITG